MKKILVPSLMLLSACGCTGMNHTEQGAVSGGLIGGLIGLAVGGRHPAAAAAIGAGTGAVAGGLIGNTQDRREDRRNAQVQAIVNERAAKQMSIHDVVQMSQQKTPDQIIINQFNTTGSRFDLRSEDILYLRQQGVSDRVVSEMQVRAGPRAVIVAPPPPPYYYGGGVVIGR